MGRWHAILAGILTMAMSLAIGVVDAAETATDVEAPTLIRFELNLVIDAETLTLSFSEPVDFGTLQPDLLVLQSTAAGDIKHTLTGGTAQSQPGTSATVQLTLTLDDVTHIKATAGLGESLLTTYLVMNGDAIKDINGVASTISAGVIAAKYTPEDGPVEELPVVERFDLNMNDAQLIITFSVRVDPETFKPEQITLQNTNGKSVLDSDVTYTLTDSSVDVSGVTSAISVVVKLSDGDMVAMENIDTLVLAQGNTFMSIKVGAFEDVIGLPLAPINSNDAMAVDAYTPLNDACEESQECGHLCKNTATDSRGYTCECYPHFTLTSDGISCDVDQFWEDSWETANDGSNSEPRAVDKNECIDKSLQYGVCSGNAENGRTICENIVVSAIDVTEPVVEGHRCACPPGQNEVLGNCRRNDGCRDGTNNCAGDGVKCEVNTNNCVCKSGFFSNEDQDRVATDEITCLDLKECDMQKSDGESYCDFASTSCHEEEGSFSCRCLTGFITLEEDTLATRTARTECLPATVGAMCRECANVGAKCVRTVSVEGEFGSADQYTHECVCGAGKAWDNPNKTLAKCVLGSKAVVCGFLDPNDPGPLPDDPWSSSGDEDTLQCDLGTIESIEFAEWGQPTGTCGNLTRGANASCSSDARIDVDAECLGESRCVIDTSKPEYKKDFDASCGAAPRLYVQAKCSCDNGIKDGDVCRCPCEDSDTINELHLEVQARILHFTEAFKKESKYWEGDGAADGTAKAKTQKVVTSLEVVTDAHGLLPEACNATIRLSKGGLPADIAFDGSFGLLEVQVGGTWGTVCNDYFDADDATVACRELGYKQGEVYPYPNPDHPDFRFVHTDGMDIAMDDVQCTGTESSFKRCPNRGFFVHNCDHDEDVALRCTEPFPQVESECPVLRFDEAGQRAALVISPSSGVMLYEIKLPGTIARTDSVTLTVKAGTNDVAKYQVGVGVLMSALDTCGRAAIGRVENPIEIRKVVTAKMGRIEISIKPLTQPFNCKATKLHAAKHTASSSFQPICIDEGDFCTEGPVTDGAGGRNCQYRFCRSKFSDHVHEFGFGTQVGTGLKTRPLSRALGAGEAPLYLFSATLDRETDIQIAADCVDCIREGHHARPLFAANPPPPPARFGCVDWAELEMTQGAKYEERTVFRGPRESSNLETFPKCSFVDAKLRGLACVEPGRDQRQCDKTVPVLEATIAACKTEHGALLASCLLTVPTTFGDIGTQMERLCLCGKSTPAFVSCLGSCWDAAQRLPPFDLCGELVPANASVWYTKSLIIPPSCPEVVFGVGAGKPATFKFHDALSVDPGVALHSETTDRVTKEVRTATARKAAGAKACAEFEAHRDRMCRSLYGQSWDAANTPCPFYQSMFADKLARCAALDSAVAAALAGESIVTSAAAAAAEVAAKVYVPKTYRPGLELVPDIRSAGLGLSFTITFDIHFFDFKRKTRSQGVEVDNIIMSSFTTDADEVEQMLVSRGSKHDLGVEFSESFRKFKEDVDGREIVLTASRVGGPNMHIGATKCHHKTDRGLKKETDYHMAFRFDHTTKSGSILVRDITAGTKPYLIKCTSTMERRAAGRSDTLVLGMGLTDAGQRSDMGFQGFVNHIMLYGSSISTAGANIYYGGASMVNNHNLASTYKSAMLLKSENNGNALAAGESCLIEDHAQPFSFWRTVRDCTDKEKADRPGTACYKYYAGHLNDLAPRTKYELRSSVDEYVLQTPIDVQRPFGLSGVTKSVKMKDRKYDTHLHIKVWGAGGGLAPEWRATNPKRADLMKLGCEAKPGRPGFCAPFGAYSTDCYNAFRGSGFIDCQGYCYSNADSVDCGSIRTFLGAVTTHWADFCTNNKVNELRGRWKSDSECTDVNECVAVPNRCGDAECINTEGSFYCSGGGGGGFASAKVVIRAKEDLTKDPYELVICPGGHGINGELRNTYAEPKDVVPGAGGQNGPDPPRSDEPEHRARICGQLRGAKGAMAAKSCGSAGPWPPVPDVVQPVCSGGGGGAASGVALYNPTDGKHRWLIIAGGGAGASFRGMHGKPSVDFDQNKTPKLSVSPPDNAEIVTVPDLTNPFWSWAAENPGGAGGGGGAEPAMSASEGKGAVAGRGWFDDGQVSDAFYQGPSSGQREPVGFPPLGMNVGVGAFINQHSARHAETKNFDIGHYHAAGDGFVTIEEEHSSGAFTDVWIPFETTCSCIVEPNAADLGKPAKFRVIQTAVAMVYTFYDHSGCEDAFQFFRNGTQLDAEFAARSECFTRLDAVASGDPIAGKNGDGTPILPIGETIEYCVRAVGRPDANDVYYSGNECTTVSVKWGGVVAGRVLSKSDLKIGVKNTLVSGYLLTHEEHVNQKIKSWDFTESWRTLRTSDFTEQARDGYYCADEGYVCMCDGGTVYFGTKASTLSAMRAAEHRIATDLRGIRCRADAFVGGFLMPSVASIPMGCWCDFPALETAHIQQQVRRLARRSSSTRPCVAEAATDAAGMPLYTNWPRTPAGTEAVTVKCVDFGLPGGTGQVSRSCSALGVWGAPVGICNSALQLFTAPEKKFVLHSNLEVATNRYVLYNVDATACAWHCLTFTKACVSFEVFRGDTQPVCFLSNVSDDGTTRFAPSRFGNIEYYELSNLAARGNITAAALDADVTQLVPQFDQGVCVAATLGRKYGWPVNDEGAYMDEFQHLRQFEQEGCRRVKGNLVLSCASSCRYKLRVAWELLSYSAGPLQDDIIAFCGAVQTVDTGVDTGVWSQLSLEDIITSAAKLPNHCDAADTTTCEEIAAGTLTATALMQAKPPSADVEFRVFDLTPWISVESVTGIVRVEGCEDMVGFRGGLGSLQEIEGHSSDEIGPLRVLDNRRLEGSLTRQLPRLPRHGGAVAHVGNNPRLCVDPGAAHITSVDNADPSLCGCTLTKTANFSPDAEFDDGSCQTATCASCVSGSYGTCTVATATTTDSMICVLAEPDGSCPVLSSGAETAACDLCSGVVCDQPPNCRSFPGICVSTTGACDYLDLAPAATSCVDGDPFTGPDECDAAGACVGQSECAIATMVDIFTPSGTQLQTQDQVDSLKGCGTVRGSLDIQCGEPSNPIVNLDALKSIALVTGIVRVTGCDNPSTLGLDSLRRIKGEGGLAGYVLIIEDNGKISGSLNSMLPNISHVDGFARVRDNPLLCVGDFDWFDLADPLDIAHNADATEHRCGCTITGSLNFDASATVDDGSCEEHPCPSGCPDRDPLGCQEYECNLVEKRCDLVWVSTDNVTAAHSCNDTRAWTVNDTCKQVDASVICEGDDVCAEDKKMNYCLKTSSRPGDEHCTILADCFEGNCKWERRNNGESCHLDDMEHTLDKCRDGTCVRQGIDRCYQPHEHDTGEEFERALRIYNDTTCVAYGEMRPGDVVSFVVYRPDMATLASSHAMSIRILDQPILSGIPPSTQQPIVDPRPTEDNSGCEDAKASYLSLNNPLSSSFSEGDVANTKEEFTAAFERMKQLCSDTTKRMMPPPVFRTIKDAIGLYEVELLPSQVDMERICRKSCLETQLIRARVESTGADDTSSSRRFITLCGGFTTCNGPMKPQAECKFDEEDSLVCDRWQEEHALCDVAGGEPAVLAVTHKDLAGAVQRRPTWYVDVSHSVTGITPFGCSHVTKDATKDATKTCAALAEFSITDNDGNESTLASTVEVINFDVRRADHVHHVTSDQEGEYTMNFVAQVEHLERSLSQRVSMSSFAVTDGFRHDFLRANGEDKLQHHNTFVIDHTEWRTVHFLDNSTHPVSGHVTLGNPVRRPTNTVSEADTAHTLNDNAACPVVGVRVCAIDQRDGLEIACADTDETGRYLLNVIEGSSVIIAAVKLGRQFSPVDAGLTDDAHIYVFHKVAAAMEANIIDITTMRIRMQFGAGACLHPLGPANFSFVSMVGPAASRACDMTAEIRMTQRNHVFNIPAQDYTVSLVSADHQAHVAATSGMVSEIRDQGILDYFNGTSLRLRPLPEQEGLSRLILFEPTSEPPIALWEYHVVPLITLRCPGCDLPQCYENEAEPDSAADRFMVMTSGTEYNVDVVLREVFYTRGGTDMDCKVVPGSVTFSESVSEDQLGGTLPLLVERSAEGTLLGGGKGRFPVEAGPPETLPPHQKHIRAVYSYFKPPHGGGGWHLVKKRSALGRTRAIVVVQGEKALSPEGMDAFKVPEYIPLLILRRPPGDGSFASITTSHTASVAYSMTSMTSDFTTPQSMEIQPYMEKDTDLCTGAGGGVAGPIITQCKEIMGGKNVLMALQFNTERGGSQDKSLSNSVTVGVTTTIETPSSGHLTGHAGDVFLTLAMSIRFRKLTHISVTVACNVSSADTQKWFFAAHSKDDMDVNEEVALNKLTEAGIVKKNQIPTAAEAFGDGKEKDGILGLRTRLKMNFLSTAYTDSDARWNTHAVHTLYDIMFVRIPQLEDQITASSTAIKCIETYDDTCPSIDVVQQSVYGTAALHRMRILVAKAGVQGWKNTLSFAKGLEEKAVGSPQMAMSTQEIWTADMNEGAGAAKGKRAHANFQIALGSMANALGEQDYLETYTAENDLYEKAKDKIGEIHNAAQTAMKVIDIAGAVSGILKSIVKNGIKRVTKFAGRKAAAKAAAAKDAADTVRNDAYAAAMQMVTDAWDNVDDKVDDVTAAQLKLKSQTESLKKVRIGDVDLGFNRAVLGVQQAKVIAADAQAYAMETAKVLDDFADKSVDAAQKGAKNKFAKASGQIGEAARSLTATTVNAIVERLKTLSEAETDPMKRNQLEIVSHYVMLVDIAFAEVQQKKVMASRNIISFSGGPTYEYNYESSHDDELAVDSSIDMEIGGGVGSEDDVSLGPVGLDLSSQSDMRYNLAAEKTHATGSSKHSSVSFTLHDEDIGDSFDVAIFKDPVYGTPVFRTLSGRSLCPHETRTVSREKVRISFEGSRKTKTITLQPNENTKTTFFLLSDLSTTGDSGPTMLALDDDTTLTQAPLSFAINTEGLINLGALEINPIPPNVAKRYTFTVRRPIVPNNPDNITVTYEGIRLEYWSHCEYELFVTSVGGLIPFEGTDYDSWKNASTLEIKSSKTVNGVTFDKIDITVVMEPKEPAAAVRRLRSLVGDGLTRHDVDSDSVLSPGQSQDIAETVAAGMASWQQLVFMFGAINVALLSIIVAMRRSQMHAPRKNPVARQRRFAGQGARPRVAMGVAMLGLTVQLAASASAAIDPAPFACHQACYCSVGLMYCKSAGLTAIPALPDNNATRTVNFAYNSIRKVEASDFSPTRPSEAVRSLQFDGNPITMIGPNAIAHMSRLETLSLAGTSLRMLAPDILKPFSNLTWFDASGTFLGHVWLATAPLSELDRLHTVKFSNVDPPLLGINSAVIPPVPLRTLDVSQNKIEVVAGLMFAKMLDTDVVRGASRDLNMSGNPSVCVINATTLELTCQCADDATGPACGSEAPCDSDSTDVELVPSAVGSRQCPICGSAAKQDVNIIYLRWSSLVGGASAEVYIASTAEGAPVNAAGTMVADGAEIVIGIHDFEDESFAAPVGAVPFGVDRTNESTWIAHLRIGDTEVALDVSCTADDLGLNLELSFVTGVLTVSDFETARGRSGQHCPTPVEPVPGSWCPGRSLKDLDVCRLECPDDAQAGSTDVANGTYAPNKAGHRDPNRSVEETYCLRMPWLSPALSPPCPGPGYAICVDGIFRPLDDAVVPGSDGTDVPDFPHCEYIYAPCETIPPSALPPIPTPRPCGYPSVLQEHCPKPVPPDEGMYNNSCAPSADAGICGLECPSEPPSPHPGAFNGVFEQTTFGVAQCMDGEWHSPDHAAGVNRWAGKLPHCEYEYASCADAPPSAVPVSGTPRRCEICSSGNRQPVRAITFRWVTSSSDRAVVQFSADRSYSETAEPNGTVTVQSISVSSDQAFSSSITVHVEGLLLSHNVQVSCEDTPSILLEPHRQGVVAIGDVYAFGDNGSLVIVGFETSAGRNQASCADAVAPMAGTFPSSCSNVRDLDICVLECPLRPVATAAIDSGQFQPTGDGLGACVDGDWKTPDYTTPEPQLDGYGEQVPGWDAKLPFCEYAYASCDQAPATPNGVPAYVAAPRCEICGPYHALHPDVERITSLTLRWDLHSPSSGNTIEIISAANSGIWTYAPVTLAHGDEMNLAVTVGAPLPVPVCDVFRYSGSKVMPATLVFRLVGGGTDCANAPTGYGYAPTMGGADCTNFQSGYASVTGSPLSAGPFASASCGSTDSMISVYGNEEAAQGDMLTVHDIRASTICTVSDSNGGQQTITIHTSGSKPLALGDRFGGLELVGFTNAHGTSSEFCPHPAIRATNRATGEVADLDTSCWTTLAIGDGLNFNDGDLTITGFTMSSGRSKSQCPAHSAAFYPDCAGYEDGSLCALQCPEYADEYSSSVASGNFVLTGATSDLDLKQCWDGEWDYAFQGTAASLGSNGWPLGSSAGKRSKSSAGLFNPAADDDIVVRGDAGTSFCQFVGVPHAEDHTMAPTTSPPTRPKKKGTPHNNFVNNFGGSKKKKNRKMQTLDNAGTPKSSQLTDGDGTEGASGSSSHAVGIGVGIGVAFLAFAIGLTWWMRRDAVDIVVPKRSKSDNDSEHYVTGGDWQQKKADASATPSDASNTEDLSWD